MSRPGAIVTLNAGSSSIKASVFETSPVLRLRLRAAAENSAGSIHFIATDADGTAVGDEHSHGEAMRQVIDFAEYL